MFKHAFALAEMVSANYCHAKPASPKLFKAALFVASHGYHHGDHEPGNQDSEHNIIEGSHTITAKKKAAR